MPHIPAELSDLFFNHHHAGYDGLYDTDTEPSAQGIADTVLQDAYHFLACYPLTCAFFGAPISAYALTHDFLHRL